MNREEILRKECIKIIHTLKWQAFSDDADRREFMVYKWKKDSLTKFTIDELREFVDILGGKVYAFKKNQRATKKQISLIEALWQSVSDSKSPLGLRKFIARILKESTLKMHLSYLSKDEATKTILALKAWGDKKGDVL